MVKVAKHREELGMQTESASLHMTFKGSPGTGKTTVARIIGELLKSNGLLSKGHFREASRADLVGSFQGQTAEKVTKLFEEMDGGVLFLDEAYSLVQDENDSFGHEAVDILIAELENRRKDMVVILAGYPDELDKLFKSNPGFASRIPNHFLFPDYSSEELNDLLLIQLKSQGLNLTQEAESLVRKFITEESVNQNVDGNGRWVRNLSDKIKRNQANRLGTCNDFSPESLERIIADDIPAAN